MMKILGLEDYSVNLQDVLEQKVEISTIIHSILFNQIEMNRLIESQKKANQIALNSFENLPK